MKERIAQSALMFGVCYMVCVTALYLCTGGFTTELLGMRISLDNLKQPMIITMTFIVVWLILSKYGMAITFNSIEYIEHISLKSHRNIAYFLGLVAALYLCLLKIKQHFTFQTTAYDLGIQASVAWNTIHGHLFHSSLQNINYLGDHFSPIYAALSPLYALWQNAATLLIIQSIGIGLASIALYLLALENLQQKWLAVIMTILFLFHPYLHRVSAFDFHPIALAIPIFLWILYFLEKGRSTAVIFLCFLAVTVEETLLPPLIGLGIYMSTCHKDFRRIGYIIAILVTLYFVFVLKIGMPFFLKENHLTHIGRYTNLGGNSLDEIVHALWRNPLIFFRELVVPFQKVISLVLLFLSVGFLPLFSSQKLILLLAPILPILVSNYSPQWQFHGQYSATTLPFLFFCSVYGLNQLQNLLNRLWARWGFLSPASVAQVVCLGCIIFIYYNFYHSPFYIQKWSPTHVEAISGLLKEIPPTASVCATYNIIPHLINRHHVVVFGTRNNGVLDLRHTEYLLLDTQSSGWPLSREEFLQAVAEVYQSKAYILLKGHDGVVLLKRTTTSKDS
jgi:uncharacterized membrane protein